MTAHARPRLLIEDWLPAAAIGVECMRENSTGLHPPPNRLHVWWARRPLTVSRAAVLASLLPTDFPRDVFERVMGFWGTAEQIVQAQSQLEWAAEARRQGTVEGRIENPHGHRAFKRGVAPQHYRKAHEAANAVWGGSVVVLDPMAGGGSIPLETARIGFMTYANEYNPVACSILEATVDYPFRFGVDAATRARRWARELRLRFNRRVEQFFPTHGPLPRHTYIFARTVPCPDTGHPTPLVPDWHLVKPARHTECDHQCTFAVPVVNGKKGTWTIEVKQGGRGPGRMAKAPNPTYSKGKAVSLFTGRAIDADYIKTMAQQGRMGSALYAVVIKTPQGLRFEPPQEADLDALAAAEKELARLRPPWERNNVIPTEKIPAGDKTGEPTSRGMLHWADMFTPRQLLCMGVLVEELRKLRPEIIKAEGEELGEAIVQLLSLALDKFLDYNNRVNTWETSRGIVKHLFQRHDFAFKATFAEMAACNAGAGLQWAIENVLDAYEAIAKLPRSDEAKPVEVSFGSAANMPQFADKSITAVVVDPPYADNVQYSELADFFYVWLKRTQGHRRPEWFSTYLCNHEEEAVVNISRHREGKEKKAAGAARKEANAFYQKLMSQTFAECRRVLRDDGVLTVMFTHKKQEAWEALFTSLIKAGFTITATWPVKTESEHSLHLARKNAAQSTVILVARKRPEGAGIGYFDSAMRREIRKAARAAAERLEGEGLNRVDQLVGSFGPAMEVYSRFDEVRTDTGQPVGVDKAIDEASDAVSRWRIEQLAGRGLEGVDSESQFTLLCWDVLGAAEFRFNEANLLAKAAGGMDVSQLEMAGLVVKKSENIRILSARERRRERALEPDEVVATLYGPVTVMKRRTKKDVLKVHPNDPQFRTALDGCHALALRYVEAGGGGGGVGSAKALCRQQNWGKDSPTAKLMEALVKAAPPAMWFEKGKQSAAAKFPEFRAWHELLKPLFGIEPPEWKEETKPQREIGFREPDEDEESDEETDENAEDGGEE